MIRQKMGGSNKKDSPMSLAWWGYAGIAAGLFGASKLKGHKNKRKIEIREANRELRKQKQAYMDMDITNPYKGLTNAYLGMENTAEDLTVNQQSAEFQAQQQSQQRADIMAGLRGAAGASGLAGLAQSLARQQASQTQQISASIAEQEATNERMAANQAFSIQRLQRDASMDIQSKQAYGDYLKETRDMQRQETLLAGAYQRSAAAMEAQTRHKESVTSAISGIAGNLLPLAFSQRKLKRNITLVGKSPSGLNIYNFEYINPKHGEGVYHGVMSDEMPKEAVLNHPEGYEMVNYNLIDVDFKKIK